MQDFRARAPAQRAPTFAAMSGGTAGKRVISLLDDDEDELERSRRLTRERREQRRRGGTAASSAAKPSEAVASDSWRRPKAAITCPICFCETEPGEACVLASCAHAFCIECLKTFVSGKVETGEVLPSQLVCPCVEPQRCGVPLLPQDVQRCLSDAAAAERYERLTLQRCIEVGDGFGACPGAGCPYLFAWEEDNRKLECPLCHNSFCLVCRTSPWHRGKRCEEFQAERGDEGASDALFKRFTATQRLRQCPKCRFWVEKTDGCDAMHCRCNLVFCYVCGGVLKKTAKKTQIKVCECGADRAEEMRIHESSSSNHNLR